MILFWALLTFLPSCVCIFICYLRIFYTARRHAHEISAMETSLRKRLKIQFIRKDARYAKTLAIVISVFLILCLPIQVGVASAFFIVLSAPPPQWVENVGNRRVHGMVKNLFPMS